MEHIVTVESVILHYPCYKLPDGSYDVARIREIVGDGIALIDGLRLALDGLVPADDAIWYATRDSVLDPDVMVRWPEVVVTRAVTNHALGSSIDAWARRWLSGEDRTKESALAAAISGVIEVSASNAAWAAEALSEFLTTSMSAMRAADWNVWASLEWAAHAARWAAHATWAEAHIERKQQVADLIAILEEIV